MSLLTTNPLSQKYALVPCILTDRDKHRIKAHLIRLRTEDRRLRFFAGATDETISKYVDSLNFEKECGIGLYVDRKLVGFAHLTAIVTHNGKRSLEIGLSIDEIYRGIGAGQALLDRAITYCKARDVDIIFMSCLRENSAMQHIAQKAGLRVVVDQMEASAEMNVNLSFIEKQSVLAKELVANKIAILDKYYQIGARYLPKPKRRLKF